MRMPRMAAVISGLLVVGALAACSSSGADSGSGDAVAAWTLNGEEMRWTLQVPEQRLRPGRNLIEVARGAAPDGPRLVGSSAALHAVTGTRDTITYALTSAVPSDLLFAGVAPNAAHCADATGAILPLQCRPIEQSGLLLVQVPSRGDFIVQLSRR